MIRVILLILIQHYLWYMYLHINYLPNILRLHLVVLSCFSKLCEKREKSARAATASTKNRQRSKNRRFFIPTKLIQDSLFLFNMPYKFSEVKDNHIAELLE